MIIYQNNITTINQNVDIKFSAHDAFLEINFIRYAQNQKIGKPNDVKF